MMHTINHSPIRSQAVLAILLMGLMAWRPAPAAADPWNSVLYGADWSPTPELSFETDKILQDFSYAGYRKGETAVPDLEDVPVFDALLEFGADPTGSRDSTAAIQAALDAAGQAGGGIVWLPAGLYRVRPRAGEDHALRIAADGVVLRGAGPGKTFILNTATDMRARSVLLLEAPESAGLAVEEEPVVRITRDLMTPTRRIPLENAATFEPGDRIVINADVNDDWVREHQETRWLGQTTNRYMRLGSFTYLRDVIAVDRERNEIEIDIPLRYFLRTRDNARVYPKTGLLTEVGVEQFSIGNVEHSGRSEAEWQRQAWEDPDMTGGYQSHSSWLIRFNRAADSWVRHVHSFQYEGNRSTAHMLSNGLMLNESSRITVSESTTAWPSAAPL